MKLHLLTVGEPKLAYAKQGWDEYYKRLGRFHQLRVTHVPDKHAYDAAYILGKAGQGYKIVLEIEGKQLSSQELAGLLDQRAPLGQELCFIIGGPEGLPEQVRAAADYQWSLSKLTLPHDLAMVTVLEALYRASSILAGHPYHK